MAKKEPLYPHVPKSQMKKTEEEYAPYSKEGWEDHLRQLSRMLDNIKTGSIIVKSAYITNPNYGGYSYTEAVTRPGVTLITGMVDYADPEEVLQIAEAGGLKEVSLAGGWWTQAGFEGWGQKIPIDQAKVLLPEWKVIFLGRLPKRT
ncbi:hypothetical protein ES703_73006 [subsurface metagenome]